MDEPRNSFHTARRDMIDAFVDLSTLALRAGVPEIDISMTHGQFFDGNMAIKDAFRNALLMALTHPSAPRVGPVEHREPPERSR
ncbi:MAG: hypothetical protein ACRDRO_03050 [Pseudonocardiaceae bacterium]